jgi:predicted house-cleaning noncanonical NTP pyrophosphatase (MazG superfamily)
VKKTTQLNFLSRRIEAIQLRLANMDLFLQSLKEWIGSAKQNFSEVKVEESISPVLELIAGLENARSVTEQRVEFCRKRNDALIAAVSLSFPLITRILLSK